MNTYECFYKDKRYTVTASTSYAAQCKCAADNRIPEKKRHAITVVLAAKEGEPVVHLPLI